MRPNCLYISLIILLFLSSVSVSFGQTYLIGGVLKEKDANVRIAEAQIINQRTGLSVSSSGLGLFQIKAAIGDTLLIIKREYSDFTAAVTTTKDMIIYLSRDRNLKEVKIYGQSKKAELDDIKREYRNKGSFYQGKPPFLAFIFKPLTAVYELFGRTPRNARRFGRYYENEMQQTLIDRFFNEDIIQRNTDLREKDLEDFMLNYRPEYENAKKWADYDALKYIKDSYKKYTDTLRKK
ncbi:hypothetical protein [Pedobacter frigoris]|uniref:hypothetical protein n=1 Tax=Pedobacter frigoris TaxID=2571272 RepID=UPI002930EE66|nr:hypothetical protein [Pedobacter frigoris]